MGKIAMPFMSILGTRQISKSKKPCPGSPLSLVLEPPQRAVLSLRKRLLGSSVSSLTGRSLGGQKHQKHYRSSLFANKLSMGLFRGRKVSHCDGSPSCRGRKTPMAAATQGKIGRPCPTPNDLLEFYGATRAAMIPD